MSRTSITDRIAKFGSPFGNSKISKKNDSAEEESKPKPPTSEWVRLASTPATTIEATAQIAEKTTKGLKAASLVNPLAKKDKPAEQRQTPSPTSEWLEKAEAPPALAPEQIEKKEEKKVLKAASLVNPLTKKDKPAEQRQTPSPTSEWLEKAEALPAPVQEQIEKKENRPVHVAVTLVNPYSRPQRKTELDGKGEDMVVRKVPSTESANEEVTKIASPKKAQRTTSVRRPKSRQKIFVPLDLTKVDECEPMKPHKTPKFSPNTSADDFPALSSVAGSPSPVLGVWSSSQEDIASMARSRSVTPKTEESPRDARGLIGRRINPSPTMSLPPQLRCSPLAALVRATNAESDDDEEREVDELDLIQVPDFSSDDEDPEEDEEDY